MKDWRKRFAGYFAAGAKKDLRPLLGVEVEHFIVDGKTGEAVPYSGEKGIKIILGELMEFYPEAELLPEDEFLGFEVPDFTITLEPAAQLEISIAPMESIDEIGEVYGDFTDKLRSVLGRYGYSIINAGCQPVSRVSELEMIPKKRYELMDAYFRGTGTGGIEMMRGTASLQVSIDYASEEDFRRKIQAAYFYGPLFKLLCDNSETFQGEKLKGFLKRTDIWRRVDPARCGILPGLFSDSYGFSDYVSFLGAMPPIFLKRGSDIIPTGSRSCAEIFEEQDMEEEDIGHVISMAFPDVRLKQFLETRFADSVELPYIKAYCALVKGLLCSEEGLSYAAEKIKEQSVTEELLRSTEDALAEKGWDASVWGMPAAEAARVLLSLAERNLEESEAAYLRAFEDVIEHKGILKLK